MRFAVPPARVWGSNLSHDKYLCSNFILYRDFDQAFRLGSRDPVYLSHFAILL